MGGEWETAKIGDVCLRVTKGTTPTTGGGAFSDSGIAFIKVEAITESGGFLPEKFAYIDAETDERLARSRLKEHDILFTIAGTIGRVAQVTSDVLPANTNQAVAIVRPRRDMIYPRFLYYALRDSNRIQLAQSKVVQSVQANFSLGELGAIELPLPPQAEQRAIAHILGTLDDKIELNRRRNQTLEAMARALFKDWFIDFGPVRRNAAKAQNQPSPGLRPPSPSGRGFENTAHEPPPSPPGRGAGGEGLIEGLTCDHLFPDHLDDDGKPEGWKMVPLDGIAELVTTSVSPGKSPDTVFEHYSIPAFDAGRMPAMELGESIKSNKYIVDADVVLVSKLNPQTPRVWLPSVATDRAVCSTEFMQFVPRDRKNRPFLYCLMTSELMQEEVLKHVTGSTGSRQRAQPSQIAKVDVLIPQSDILTAFNHQVASILRAVVDNQRESQTLAQLRDTLLPKLISGEIRMNPLHFLESEGRQS